MEIFDMQTYSKVHVEMDFLSSILLQSENERETGKAIKESHSFVCFISTRFFSQWNWN